MRYLRFESQVPYEGASSRLGIFQIAYRLRDADDTRVHDANEIARLLLWLKTHLHAPEELSLDANKRAICWFKSAAHEPMKRMWHLKAIVEVYGYWISVKKTREPGLIIYEDGWQVAAIPRTRRPN
ncbi:hypothetical protein [Henriciella litoralis]|uniref:hypothetical protein n=1 Tax=Henriciella litoralis TaxID=568102 RepID=UPI000A0003EF|nr:hypothetical protein [Henriciella litoralis]